MSKPQKTLKVRIPPYETPANEWRKQIHEAVIQGKREEGISYSSEDELEVWVRFYFEETKVEFMDVDNRLKDVLDALQGLVGGGNNKDPELEPIIPNDNQIMRAVVEKGKPPPQSHGLGHLKIKKFSPDSSVVLTWD